MSHRWCKPPCLCPQEAAQSIVDRVKPVQPWQREGLPGDEPSRGRGEEGERPHCAHTHNGTGEGQRRDGTRTCACNRLAGAHIGSLGREGCGSG